MSRYLFMPVLWFWLTLGLMILVINRVPPFSAIAPDELIPVLEEAKLFFLAILFPLALSATHLSPPQGGEKKGEWAKHLAAFILLSLPLTVLASYFSCAESSVLVRSHLLLILIAATAVLLCAPMPMDAGRSVREHRSAKFPGRLTAYYLAFFILFGAMPILYYLVLEFAGRPPWALIAANPFYLFWKIQEPEAFYVPWFYNCLLWVITIIILFVISKFALREALVGSTPKAAHRETIRRVSNE